MGGLGNKFFHESSGKTIMESLEDKRNGKFKFAGFIVGISLFAIYLYINRREFMVALGF